MMSKKWLLLAMVCFGALFFAFRSSSLGLLEPANPRQQLLREIGRVLEEQHYDPKQIDDRFSKMVFDKFLDELDGDKTFFLQKDIDSLKVFEKTIDNEIHGEPIAFLPAVSALYNRRMEESADICKEVLQIPFDFSISETVELDGEKIQYAKSDAERKDRWRKKLKYLSLERYADLVDQREKNK